MLCLRQILFPPGTATGCLRSPVSVLRNSPQTPIVSYAQSSSRFDSKWSPDDPNLASTAGLIQYYSQGFGGEGLGIVTISNVPGLSQLRSRLLPMAAQLAVSHQSFCPLTSHCAPSTPPHQHYHSTLEHSAQPLQTIRSQMACSECHPARCTINPQLRADMQCSEGISSLCAVLWNFETAVIQPLDIWLAFPEVEVVLITAGLVPIHHQGFSKSSS